MESPEVFRPSLAVRALSALFGVVCGWAAVWQLIQLVRGYETTRLIAAGVLAMPVLLALALWRRQVTVSEEALVARLLLRTRRIPWGSVRYVDRTRSSFVAATDLGPVSAGWLDLAGREQLLRLIIQHAKLTPSMEPLRWGLVARYVPRTEEITFQSHVNRKGREINN